MRSPIPRPRCTGIPPPSSFSRGFHGPVRESRRIRVGNRAALRQNQAHDRSRLRHSSFFQFRACLRRNVVRRRPRPGNVLGNPGLLHPWRRPGGAGLRHGQVLPLGAFDEGVAGRAQRAEGGEVSQHLLLPVRPPLHCRSGPRCHGHRAALPAGRHRGGR